MNLTAVQEPLCDNPISHPTLLIVDDDPINLKLLEAMLDKKKFKILKANNGKEAIEIAEEKLPDIILLDIMMPRIDGFEVTKILKKNPSTANIPIILLTALEGSEHKKKGMEYGAEEFLNKPVNILELLSRINMMIRLRLYREEVDLRKKSTDEYSQLITQSTLIENNNLPHILLVEDDPKDAKLIRAYIDAKEYNITAVESGEEAIKMITRGERFDVAILDVMLPDISGFDLCKQIKRIRSTRNTPIIYTTSLSDLEAKIQGIESESDGFLTKPIDKRVLVAKIRMLLKKKALLDDLFLDKEVIFKSAISDGLTGLYNYAYFIHMLDNEITRSKRHQQQFGLLLIDLDNFKMFNDTLGHLKGDKVLQLFGNLVNTLTRSVDVAARYGGEEFAVILPNTDLLRSVEVAQRICQATNTMSVPFKIPSCIPGVTVSIGVSVYPGEAENSNDLITKADDMLYQAKRNGKNQVAYTSPTIY